MFNKPLMPHHSKAPVPPVNKQAPVPHQVKQEIKPVFPKAPPNPNAFFDALSKDDQNKQKSWLI